MVAGDARRGRHIRRGRLAGLAVMLGVVALGALGSFGAGAASAKPKGSGALNFYVALTGTNTDNTCQSRQLPCQTISYAVGEQGAVDHGGTIHVGAGTFSDSFTLGPQNSGVTITGTSTKRTTIAAPVSGLASTTDPNAAKPLYYVVGADGGASNITLQNFTVNGTTGQGALASTGCTEGYAGIYFDDASGSLSKLAVTGIDMPASNPTGPSEAFNCAGESRGVYVASGAGPQPSTNVSMTGLSMTNPACVATTDVAVPAGTSYTSGSPGTLGVVHLPKGKGCKKHWTEGNVLIDGALFQASAFGPRNIQIVGTAPYTLPAGSLVNAADPFDPAYGDVGVECADANTNCSISGATIDGEGSSDLVSQTGIEVLAASATVNDNKVSANSYSGGTAGVPAAAVRGENGGTIDVTGNTLSANDQGVEAAWSNTLAVSDPVSPDASTETFSSGQTTTDDDTLTAGSATFQPTDVGRSVTVTVSPSTALSASSVGVTLPVTTLNVTSTSEFVTPGTLTVPVSSGTTTVTCTGMTAASFTGCSGGTGTTVAGNVTEAPHGVSLGYVAQYVSPEVVLLSEPATVGGTGETITLGVLPGEWDVTGNSADQGTAVGASAGVMGYGDGIVLDSTDSCLDANENADLVVTGNTADGNAAAGILALGASCATIGTTANPNEASGNDVGLDLNGPGSACSPCSPTALGYASNADAVAGNTLSKNNFGVVAGGITEPVYYGGPPSTGPGTSHNAMTGNTWQTNTLANVVDFDNWGGATCASCSDALASSLTAGIQVASVSLTTAVTLAEGSIVQITQGAAPTLVLIVSQAVTGSFTVPVGAVTPSVTYSAGDAVAINPFNATNPTPTNSWTGNSCNPSPGASAAFQGNTFNAGYVSC